MSIIDVDSRSLLRGHARRIAEYALLSSLFFVLSLAVISAYVEQLGLQEWAARGATSLTLAVLVFGATVMVWRQRELSLGTSARRWTAQRVGMTVFPHALYLAMVGVLGLPYLGVQIAIAVLWGALIAFPLNYLLCDRWSMKENDKV